MEWVQEPPASSRICAIDKARQRSRDALLSYRPKSAEVGTILPFVLTYHPDLPKVRDIVDKNWSIIESSNELKDIYQSKPVMAFRCPKSLRDFLVRAGLKPNSDDDNFVNYPTNLMCLETLMKPKAESA